EFKKLNTSDIPLEKSSYMVESYVNRYYLMDLYYRKFYVAYDNCDVNEVMQKLRNIAEDIYTNWFMVELSHNWTKSLMLEDNQFFDSPVYRKQEYFYKDIIKPKIENGDRVFVIVSDALRYDVAAEISDRLDTESLGSANLNFMISTPPTVTKLGM